MNLFKNLLIRLSVLPYRVTIQEGNRVKLYTNGKLIANKL